MSSYNKCILLGHLTRDIELRYTPKGTCIGQVGLAVNRTWTDEGGEKHEEVSFIDCTFWGKQAETAAQYCHKGDPILVDGYLKQDTWDDKQTGAKRSKIGVVVQSFQFLNRAPARDGSAPAPQRQSRPLAARQQAEEEPQPDAPPMDSQDDVPF